METPSSKPNQNSQKGQGRFRSGKGKNSSPSPTLSSGAQPDEPISPAASAQTPSRDKIEVKSSEFVDIVRELNIYLFREMKWDFDSRSFDPRGELSVESLSDFLSTNRHLPQVRRSDVCLSTLRQLIFGLYKEISVLRQALTVVVAEQAKMRDRAEELSDRVEELSQREETESSTDSCRSGTVEPTECELSDQVNSHEEEIQEHALCLKAFDLQLAAFRQQLKEFAERPPAPAPAVPDLAALTSDIAQIRAQLNESRPPARPALPKFPTDSSFVVIKSNSNSPNQALEELRRRGHVLHSSVYTSPTGFHTAFVKLAGPNAESLIATASEWAPADSFVVPYEIRPPRTRPK